MYINPFHYVFAKMAPLIRFVHEKVKVNPWYQPITPELWLGGAPMYERDYLFLEENKINAVVDIRAEAHDDVERYKRNGTAYIHIDVLDMIVPTPADLDLGVAFMKEQVDAGRIVLVHCAKGRGRSATLLAAYLMLHNGMSYDDAHALLKRQRRLTKLERRHQRLLESWIKTAVKAA